MTNLKLYQVVEISDVNDHMHCFEEGDKVMIQEIRLKGDECPFIEGDILEFDMFAVSPLNNDSLTQWIARNELK